MPNYRRRNFQSLTDHPLLTDRRNIIVIVDEAHRGHYDNLDGYARHIRDALPNAVFIAFTGTPLSFADRNTRDVFGKDIDIYDLSRAVADNATVPVYFEPRRRG
jgi:type I restriction enzyme, R subunit